MPSDPAKLAENIARWKKFRETSLVMTMTPEELRAVVPVQTASYKPGCVNCKAGGVDRHGVTRAGRWFWPYRFDPLKPNEGTCAKCGMKFPNAKYPTDRKQVFYSPSGVRSEHSYWEDPKTKARYFIDVEIAGKGWEWMEKQALGPLVAAYNDTGDEEYAYRASIFLDEVAGKFPAYVWGANNNKYLKFGRTVNKDGSMGGVDSFDFFWLPFGKIHDYRGFLVVPADGTYVFHFRPGAKGSLTLGGVTVSPERDYRVSGNIVPRRAWVRLRKGYVPIHFVFKGSGGGRYGGKGCGFTFQGPGIPRTLFRSGDFFHTPGQVQTVVE
ncbi:MAG: hypothetical protein ACYTFI_07235 [Planctomycetota bacterium]